MTEPRRGGTVRTGVIAGEGACELLLELGRDGATGVLEAYSGGRVRSLVLRRGVPIHAHPGAVPWRLGDVISHLGLRSGRDALALGARERWGDALVRQGKLSRSSVERALKEQIRLRAQELLSLRDGRYRFYAGAAALRSEPRQPDRWTAQDLVAAVRRGQGRHEELWWQIRRLEESSDPREALDLPPCAGPDQARAAFRRLARDHHPDRLQGVTDPVALALHRRVFAAALRASQRLEA
jgi:hypothetical protein